MFRQNLANSLGSPEFGSEIGRGLWTRSPFLIAGPRIVQELTWARTRRAKLRGARSIFLCGDFLGRFKVDVGSWEADTGLGPVQVD